MSSFSRSLEVQCKGGRQSVISVTSSQELRGSLGFRRKQPIEVTATPHYEVSTSSAALSQAETRAQGAPALHAARANCGIKNATST